MKKIIINLFLFSSIFLLNSCDEKQWPTPDIQLADVYVLSNLKGDNAPSSIEVFGQNDFVVVFRNSNVSSLAVTNYKDSTDVNKFNIRFTMQESIVQIVNKIENRYVVKKEYACMSDSVKSVFTSNLEGEVNFGYGKLTVLVDTIEGALGSNPKKTLVYTMAIRKDTRRL